MKRPRESEDDEQMEEQSSPHVVSNADSLKALSGVLSAAEFKSMIPKSVFEQLKTKRGALEFNQRVQCAVAGRRGVSWMDDDKYLRVYVAKQFGGPLGNELSPFHLMIDDEDYFPPEIRGLPSAPKKVALELWWQSAKLMKSESIESHAKRRKGIFTKREVKRSYFSISKEGVRGANFGGSDTIYQYVDSRYFYCKAYARYVITTSAFQFLLKLHQENKCSLLIAGPDGHPLLADEDLDAAYRDPTKQFGHERVLLSLLQLYRPTSSAAMPTTYSLATMREMPWEKYRVEMRNEVVYPDWILK